MRIGIFSPYLDALGGGERYVLTLVEFLSQNYQVEVFWNDKALKEKIKERLDLDMSKVRFVDNIFAREKKLSEKLKKSSQYDLIFFLSDGSIPSSLAKRNILHFQCPFPYSLNRIMGKIIFNKIKLSRFQGIVCNSRYTKKYIDKEYGVNSQIIYPPVEIDKFKAETKDNLIVSVGRFSKYYINKKQKELTFFFKKNKTQLNGWRLSLIGGLLEQDRSYFDQLSKLTEDVSNINLFPNESFMNLKKHYGRAKIYWHAAGFGVNEKINPAGMEHFGISTVEAMASGCVPVVFNGGGQKEIINHGLNGFLWQTEKELIDYTVLLIKDSNLREKMAAAAVKKSQNFSKEIFLRRFDEIIK